jgi:monofunctional chorismate mutase
MEQRLDKELKKLRSEIDRIDSKILSLLEKRWKTTKKIGKVKKSMSAEYYDPKREKEIIKKVSEKTILDRNFVRKIFTGIMEYCRNGERE